MSASRDQSQKFTFVYSNMYTLYKKGVEAAKASPDQELNLKSKSEESKLAGVVTAKIIKAKDLHSTEEKIREHKPVEFFAKKIEVNQWSKKVNPQTREAVSGLKTNIQNLENLHERLRFMLREIEDLSKKKTG